MVTENVLVGTINRSNGRIKHAHDWVFTTPAPTHMSQSHRGMGRSQSAGMQGKDSLETILMI